ncbi:MAG: DNA repair protein RecO [Phycisphaerae bacterium]|nr:DNA repair protein RecO [Phycisphaerae bacterium]
MPTAIDQALILRTWEFSETSQAVSLLCRARGLMRGLAKGAHRERSKFNGGLEPLTLGEIVYAAKPTAELVTLTEWDLRTVFKGVRRNLAAHRAGLYIVDLLHHAILDADPHPNLFDETVASLHALDDPSSSLAVLLRFQWRLLAETGYRPRIDLDLAMLRDSATYIFRAAEGGLVQEGTAEGWRVRGETVRALLNLDQPSSPGNMPHTANATERAGRLLSEYLRYVLGRDLPTRTIIYGASPFATSSAARHPNRV